MAGGVAVSYFPEVEPPTLQPLNLTFYSWVANDARWEEHRCPAGQAAFNPANHPGVQGPVEQGDLHGLLTRAYPIEACATSERCAPRPAASPRSAGSDFEMVTWERGLTLGCRDEIAGCVIIKRRH